MPRSRGISFFLKKPVMNEKRYINASEISLYTFCPRAWALKQLDYPMDNQWEVAEGKKYHEEVGRKIIIQSKDADSQQSRLKKQYYILTYLMVFILLCILSIIIRLILK